MEYPNESSLRELLQLLRRGLLPALVVGGLLGAGAFVYRGEEAPVFEAEASLVASQNAAPASAVGVTLLTSSPIDVRAYRAAATSPAMLNTILGKLGVSDPGHADRERLLSRLDVSVEETTVSSLIHVVATSASAADSAAIANATADALLEWDQQRAVRSLNSIVQTLDAQINGIDEQIRAEQSGGGDAARINGWLTSRNELLSQRDAARALRTAAVGRLEILSPALEPDAPLPKRQVTYALASALLGAFVVVAYLLLRNALDPRMRSAEELVAAIGVPVLAEFTLPRRESRSIEPETANFLRAGVLYGLQGSGPTVLLVASSDGGEGSASVAFGLAESLARGDQRTLFIDADLRRPMSGAHYNLDPTRAVSLDQYLADEGLRFEPAELRVSKQQFIHVVPSFRPVPHASELLMRGFRARIEEWSRGYDIVVVNAPPLLRVSDGLTMAVYCSGVLLVCNLRKANRNKIRRATQLLERVRVRLVGAAVTGGGREGEAAAEVALPSSDSRAWARRAPRVAAGPVRRQ